MTSPEHDGSADRPDPAKVDCAVVAVTHNSAAHLEAFLGSIAGAAGSLTVRVVIVDNCSTDDTVAIARASAGVVCVESANNLGYAGGINLGRRHAGAFDTLLIANPDLRFHPGAIERLHHAAMDHGAAVPALVDGLGRVQRSLRREPTIGRQLGEATLGDHLRRRPSWLSEIVRDERAYDVAHDAEWATGAVLMTSSECDAAVGDWDASYFLYSEEVDYAERIRRAGYAIRFEPAATAEHDEGGSGRSSSLMVLSFLNRIRYYASRHRRAAGWLFAGGVVLQVAIRSRDRDHRRALGAVIRGAPGAVNRPDLTPAFAAGPRP
jgi:GT2 family glycosyltransferase